MRLTIKSDDCEVYCEVDPLKRRSTNKSIRAFGLMLMRGVNSLDKTGYYVNFILEDGPRKYTTPMFKETRFFSKAIKAVSNKTVCECGATILCSCHKKCEKCVPCEAATKTAGVVDRMAIQVLNGMSRFNEQYDDREENESRGNN